MKFKIVKLDGRYAHRNRFSHMLEFYKGNSAYMSSVIDYDRACRWFVEHFGWAADVEIQMTMGVNRRSFPNRIYTDADCNDSWAHCSKYDSYRIYVKSVKELEWFLLANPNEA